MARTSPTEALGSPAETFVPIPDDLISDESDFYGSPDTKSYYNKLEAGYRVEKYWATHGQNAQVVAIRGKQAQKLAAEERAKQEAEKRAKAEAEAPASNSTTPYESGAKIAVDQDQNDLKDDEATLSPSASPSPSLPVPDPMDLDSTPSAQNKPAPAKKSSIDNNDNHYDDDTSADNSSIKLHNYYEGRKNAKQLSESVSDFLARLPPSTTTTATGGPWIWIANPYPDRNRNSDSSAPKSSRDRNRVNAPEAADVFSFKQLGLKILEAYDSRKRDLRAQHPDKPTGSITRMLLPDRMGLEPAILQAAQATNVTCGKWMLFPNAEDVDRVWAIVAQGTWEGKLGIGAKVAVATDTPDEEDEDENGGHDRNRNSNKNRRGRLICIYTYNFADKADVKRVLLGMKDLGLLDSRSHNQTSYGGGGNQRGFGGSSKRNGLATIYYKCDAYTYLDIVNGNDYKLKASMYCSKDFL